MHIVFLNPQGNFDPKDSYLTEHPDFGGQLVYVKELAQALATNGHKVDIVTRKIIDSDWPEFSANQDIYPGTEQNLRILRFPCGGNKFLSKEELWPHLSEFADEILSDVINCKTAYGFNDIKIPGEIERYNKVNSDNKIYLPKKTWDQLITIVSKQNKKL